MMMVDTVYWLPIACGLSRLASQSPRSVLYSSREPSELSQCLCHDVSTINIVIGIIIIIIMFIIIIIIIIIV